MADGYSRSPKLLKGALVELSEPFLGPVPNIIVFQYNPETMSRDLTPWSADVNAGGRWGQDPSAQPFDPGESFSLTLELDATDALEEGNAVAIVSGVADRIAALEMLLYPVADTGSVLGQALRTFGPVTFLPRGHVSVVLFVWGPGRIVPVRLTSFAVEEQAFSPTLYPLRAKVTVGLQVLTADSFTRPGTTLSASEQLAVVAYKYTRAQKEILARLNLANTVESILGLLPF
jgi:hypothetical protein